MVITDHHQPLDVLPVVPALVNPQISPDYPFSDLCGVGVAYKVINAIAEKINKYPLGAIIKNVSSSAFLSETSREKHSN